MAKRSPDCPPCKNVKKEPKESTKKRHQTQGLYSFITLIAVSFMWAIMEQQLLAASITSPDKILATMLNATASTASVCIWVYIIWGFIRSKHMSFRLMIILISVFVVLLVVTLLFFPIV